MAAAEVSHECCVLELTKLLGHTKRGSLLGRGRFQRKAQPQLSEAQAFAKVYGAAKRRGPCAHGTARFPT